jgi:hypothetical protein
LIFSLPIVAFLLKDKSCCFDRYNCIPGFAGTFPTVGKDDQWLTILMAELKEAEG